MTEVQTFAPDSLPSLTLALRDDSGVGQVIAFYQHEDGNSYFVLKGDGEGSTNARVTLWPGEHSGFMAPGDYECRRIEAHDVAGNTSEYTPDSHPELVNKTFRCEYPSGEQGDTEGPELVG